MRLLIVERADFGAGPVKIQVRPGKAFRGWTLAAPLRTGRRGRSKIARIFLVGRERMVVRFDHLIQDCIHVTFLSIVCWLNFFLGAKSDCRSGGGFIAARTSCARFSFGWIMLLHEGRGLSLPGAATGPVPFEAFGSRVPPLLPEAWNAFGIGIGCHSFPSIVGLFGCLFCTKRLEEF